MSYRKIEVQLMVLLFTIVLNQSYAQTQHWQIGIGMSPREDIFDPWYLILKRSLNSKLKIRSGLGISYKRSLDYSSYFGPPLSLQNGDTSAYYFGYKYQTITNMSDYRLFLGFERRMEFNRLGFFISGNMHLNYQDIHQKLDDRILYDLNIAPFTQLFNVASFDRVRALRAGVSLSLGIEYSLSTSTSIALEMGVTYYRNTEETSRESFHLFFEDYDLVPPIDYSSFISISQPARRGITSDFYFSMIDIVTLQYRW